MSNQTGRSIRAQLMWLSLIIVTVSVALSLAGTLYITLRTERKTLDQNLLNSASILSQVPLVREALLGEVPADELADFLDAATARTSDIDLILVGDTESVLRYAPDRSFIGSRYTGSAQTSALAGAEPYTFDDSGPMGSDHSAYAPIRDESGAVIGFMAVGLYLRSLTHVALTTALRLAAIGALAAAVGALLALRLSRRIKRSLMGYEPDAFARRFHQREDILEALEEGILAIDREGRIIFLNAAAAQMLSLAPEAAMGRPLHSVYPSSTLDRILRTGRPEYNVSMKSLKDVRVLADRLPLYENGVTGAVQSYVEGFQMSATSSGGVRSSTEWMASMIRSTGSSKASIISVELTVTTLGRPVSRQRPFTSMVSSSSLGKTQPICFFISSAVRSPTSRLCLRRMYLTTASFSWSPAILMEVDSTMPDREMTAMSVVPPPMSTIMWPSGLAMSMPAPMAAATGSSIR